MNEVKVIHYTSLTDEEQCVYDKILNACLQRNFDELRESVEVFQTKYGRSMRDVYFKMMYNNHSGIPVRCYERLHYLLSIGCHYVITPLSILCYPQSEQDTLRTDMIEYLLKQNADPNISILIYLPIQKRIGIEINGNNTRKVFPFPLENFSYDFAKVMYYETLLHTISPSPESDSNIPSNKQMIWKLLVNYWASTCIPDFHGKLPLM